ncbi:MAG: PRC-barrel domain-containing protein [Desulfuromonadales bacterium]
MAKTAWMAMTAFLLALFSAGTVFAAEMGAGQAAVMTGDTLHSAKAFIGTEVRDRVGQELGEIQDLAFDFDRGIGYAVVSGDEALQTDGNFLVPLHALTTTHEGDYVILNMSREQLAAMPQREAGMTDQEYSRNLYDFYGLSHPWRELPGDVPVEEKSMPGSNLTYPGPRVPSEK